MAARDRRQELLALGPHLLGWAKALTRDSDEAQALVADTMISAEHPDHRPADTVSTQAWIHQLLRRSFHSIERVRSHRRSRSAAAAEREGALGPDPGSMALEELPYAR